jgi:hypothetical protein
VLFELWSSDTRLWTRRFKEINQDHLKSMSACFKKYLNGQISFETARDTIRHGLYSQNPAQFPYGTRGTSVAALKSAILAPNDYVAISSPEFTWGSGPLLRMACTSPMKFHWFLCKMTQRN